MKKVILILLMVIVLLFGAIITIPYFFKNEIVDALKTEMSKQMEADLDFEHVTISILKDFPQLSLTVRNFTLRSHDSLMNVSMDRFYFNMESMSYFGDKTIIIKNIVFEEPSIRYINTDTMILTKNEASIPIKSTPQNNSEEALVVRVDRFEISRGTVYFADSSMAIIMQMNDFNTTIAGDFSQSLTKVSIEASLKEFLFIQEGVTLVNKLPAGLTASISADLDNMAFKLQENSLQLGPIKLQLEGMITEHPKGWDMDVRFDAPGMNMQKLLTMIPESYASSVAGLKTDGNIQLQGAMKGVYIDMEHLPSFNINFNANNGFFQYPDLPESVKNINVKASLWHPNNSNLDKTVIVVDQFECSIGSNPWQSQWTFKTPVSDLDIDGFLKGNLDLATLKNVFPLENAQMAGAIVANVALKGKMSAIDQELYDQFYAAGFLELTHFEYTSNDLPQGLTIQKASMDFTPAQINLKKFNGKMGKSDIALQGYFSNYISYAFQEGTLKGRLKHQSNVLDANKFLLADPISEASSSTSSTQPEGSLQSGAIVIPDKLDLEFTSKIRNVYYDNLHIKNVQGLISVQERIATLTNLKMDLLSGSMSMTGQYNSNDTLAVFSDMNVLVNDIDVAETVAAFSSINKIAPITRDAEGRISMKLNYYAPFDQSGEIVMNKLASKGSLSSKTLRINNNASLDQLAKVTNNPKYKDLHTNAFKVNYVIEDGKVVVLPFKVNVEDKDMEIWGNHTLNNQMDYSIKTTVSPQELGSQIGGLLQLVTDPNKQLPVTVHIKGDIKKPSISIDTKDAMKELQKNVGGILKGLF